MRSRPLRLCHAGRHVSCMPLRFGMASTELGPPHMQYGDTTPVAHAWAVRHATCPIVRGCIGTSQVLWYVSRVVVLFCLCCVYAQGLFLRLIHNCFDVLCCPFAFCFIVVLCARLLFLVCSMRAFFVFCFLARMGFMFFFARDSFAPQPVVVYRASQHMRVIATRARPVGPGQCGLEPQRCDRVG